MLEDLVINSAGSFAGLKSLTIESCSGSVWQGGCASHYDLLPNLEELYLRDLNYVESISELLGQLGLRFLRLKLIEVEYCSEMKYLLPCGYSYFIYTALPNLEIMKVRSCDRLVELFSYNSMQYIASDPVVPSLRQLKLEWLPQLRTLCRDEETWPLLEQLFLIDFNLSLDFPAVLWKKVHQIQLKVVCPVRIYYGVQVSKPQGATLIHGKINRLRKFQFFIGPTANSLPTRHEERRVTNSGLNLSGEWIGLLLSDASSLILNHFHGLNELLEDLVINSVGCFAGLKSLTIASSNSSLRPGGGCTAHFDLLPNLEELYLQDLTYLESISELVGHLGLRFLRLKLIEVTRCSQMKHLLSCGYHIHTLPNLQVIKVSFCDKLDELFSYHSIQFIAPDPVVPSLRILELKYLPKLKTLYRHETAPHLEQFTVIKCNRLTTRLFGTNETADTIDEIREES
ncbi:probable disease resistance protein At4g27220 [Alnus glutinosa]|uniref:probable disease resistance protein At4g27220 n=1 Tax=Alnus glutinosa TaxID=3517 RepID=UPI002D79E05F|nr:probable disease resistance protein At4g27220 [Alnus glutinosa]